MAKADLRLVQPPAEPADLLTPAQAEMPFAVVQGEPVTQLPRDLYIPPQALEVFLEAFEGPLDLLLYLIRRQNLDILDIPLADITRQYMNYIELMNEMQLELAGEYLVMAATLAEIKSRMLLPRSSEAQAEESDPRADLVRRLQEYERFKQAAESVDRLPRLERDVWLARAENTARRPVTQLPTVTLQEMIVVPRGRGPRGDVPAPSCAARAPVGACAHDRRAGRGRGRWVRGVPQVVPTGGGAHGGHRDFHGHSGVGA